MIDHHGSPLELLILHNAVAIIVAAMLTRELRNRVVVACLALVIASGVTATVRSVNAATKLSWWLFVQEPASSVYDPFIYGTMRRSLGVLGEVGLLMLVISPFVFAYFTAWQWTTPRTTARARLGNRQLRLGTLLLAIAAGCLMLSISSWFRTGGMVIWPLVFVAACLMLRPLRWWIGVRRRWNQDRRFAEIRKRLQAGEVPGQGTSRERL